MTKLASIWLLFGGKSGDNAQVLALAETLQFRAGCDYTIKQLAHRKTELLLHLASRPTLAGITRAARRILAPPWPQLVVTAGRRNELAALWIKERAPHVRVVHLGRPWCHPERFDLVISTPQYELDGHPNVLVNRLPLNRVEQDRMAAARAAWSTEFAGLDEPRSVLLLGGNSGGFVLDARQALRLARSLETHLAARGGSLLVVSSRRTPAAFVDTLLAELGARVCYVHRWGERGENPYFGLLAWGDEFVVTEDSLSMTAEALVTGAPVWLFAVDSARPVDGSPWWLRPGNFGWKPLTHRLAMGLAPRRFHRDAHRLQDSLANAGLVAWLGEAAAAMAGEGPGARRAHAEQLRLADLDAGALRLLELLNAQASQPEASTAG